MNKYIILLFAFMMIVQTAAGYDYSYYISESGSSTDIKQGLGFDSVDSCNYSIITFYDNATQTVRTEFYEPYDSLDIYANTFNSGNCAFSGSREFINDGGTFEHETKHLNNVTNGYQYIIASCDSGTDNIIEIKPTILDSENYYSGLFYKTGTGVYPPVINTDFNNNTYGSNCIDNSFVRMYNQSVVTPVKNVFAYVPFVAGYNETEFHIKAIPVSGSLNMIVSVYAFNDTSDIAYSSYLETSTPEFDFNLSNLDPERIYIVQVSSYIVNPSLKFNFTKFEIRTIDATPDLNCTAWSVCDEITNQQERECIDLNGVVESYLDYRTCVSDEVQDFDEAVFLGFTNLTSIEVPVCVPDWTIAGCTNFVVNKSISVPANWEFSDAFTFGYANYPAGFQPYRMNAWVDLSGYNLMMWNTVPKPYEAVYNYSGTNEWECVNWTNWSPSWLSQNTSNTTMLAEYNITFPEDNMKMWFSIKKCDEQKLQYSYDECSYFFGLGSLGDLCYSSDCSDEVRGGYKFSIYDWSTGSYIYDYESNAYDDWRTYYFDLSDVNIVAGNTYRLQIQTYDPDYTGEGTCIELRNFGYGISSNEFSCTSYCEELNYHYYKAITTTEGLCIHEDLGFSSQCIPNQIDLDNYESCTSFCDSNGNYHSGSNITGVCIWTTEADAAICDEEETIYTPLVDIGDGKTAEAIENIFTSIFGICCVVLSLICFKYSDRNPNLTIIGVAFIVVALVTFGYLPYIYLIIVIAAIVIIFTRAAVDQITK